MGEPEAYVMTSLLKSVIDDGTGKRALSIGKPLAGKTGTTSQQRDGWFVGFSPSMTTGVWVGFDDRSRMGSGWAQGAGTALPIWVQFMGEALKGMPREDFHAPAGALFARIDPENGLLAVPQMAGASFEVFVEGTEPRSFSSRDVQEDSQPYSSDERVRDLHPGEKLPEGLFR